MLSLALSSTSIAALLGGSSSLAEFSTWSWFLKNDSWNLAGTWIDGVAWNTSWFLATGIITVYGAWADNEAWA